MPIAAPETHDTPVAAATAPRLRRAGRWALRLFLAVVIAGVVTGALTVGGLRFGLHYIPSAWVSSRIVDAVSHMIGERGTVQVQHARLRATDNGQRLVVDGFSVTGADGKVVVAAPRAEIDFDMTTLLFGSDAVRVIELQDLSVRLTMSREGRLTILNEDIGAAGGVGELAQSDVRTVFGVLADTLSGRSAGMTALTHFALRNGKLIIDDPMHATQLVYSNLSIQFLDRARQEIRIAADRNGRPWSVTARLLPDAERTIAVALEQLPLEDVAALLRHTLDDASAIPANGHVRLKLDENGQVTETAIEAQAQGQVRLAGADPAFALEAVAFKARWAASDQTWRFDTLTAQGGPHRFSLHGAVAREGDGQRLSIAGGAMFFAFPGDASRNVEFQNIAGEGRISPAGDIAIDQLALAGPAMKLELNGVWPAARDQTAHVTLRAGAFEWFAGLALWPKNLASHARDYVANRLDKGRFSDLTMTVRLDGAARAQNAEPHVELQTMARGVRLRAVDGLPPLDMDMMTVTVSGASVIATTPRATITTEEKTTATVGDVRFDCDCNAVRSSAKLDFRAIGAADGAFDLMATPLLRGASEGLDTLDATSGSIDLKFSLAIPDLFATRIQDIQIQFAGSMTNVSIDGAIPDQMIAGMNATLAMDANGFSLKGQARIADTPAVIDLRRPARQPGEAAITVTLDEAARAKQNIGASGALTGPVAVRFVRPLSGADRKPTRVEADLSRAAINEFLPGWTKPAGRPGKISFLLPASGKRDDLELQDFLAESAGYTVRGQIVLSKERRLRSAKLATLRLSPGDEMRADLEQSGQSMKVTARGNNFDARPFLKFLYAPSTRPAAGEPPDFDIDVRANILTGHNNEAITGAELKMMRRGGELRQFSLNGKLGGADIRGNVSSGKLLLLSGNAGGMLRFIDLYRRMIGGTMTLETSVDSQRQEGALIVQRFALRDEPALRRVTADGPPAASGEEERLQRRAIANGRADVNFDRMRIDFVRSQGRLDIKEGLMIGPIVGVTIEGIVDGPRDRVNMTGTYVPAFGLNNALAQIPVVGLFLGGPQTGSLFGVNFKITGAFSAPRVEVNPLSAVAPGFLRKFFEFRRESVEGAKIYRMPDAAGGN